MAPTSTTSAPSMPVTVPLRPVPAVGFFNATLIPPDAMISYAICRSLKVWYAPERPRPLDLKSEHSDTKGHVVPIEFWNGPEYGHRIEHTGDQSWLEFEGKWGNVGDGCWYEPFIGICQLIAGPPGPNREFGIPPSCILAPPADAGSTFKFYLSNWVVWQAQDLNVTHVLLEQVCTRPSMGASARDPYSVAPLEVHDRLPFDPEDRFYEATAARCEGGRSAAKGYRLALYRGEERVSTSPVVRPVHASGVVGVVLERLDAAREEHVVPDPDAGAASLRCAPRRLRDVVRPVVVRDIGIAIQHTHARVVAEAGVEEEGLVLGWLGTGLGTRVQVGREGCARGRDVTSAGPHRAARRGGNGRDGHGFGV
ncbi:protein-vacuolar targeting-related protein [Trichosporon asahii var. asahii CBS 2479]|uniref:Protein-vacuolar targeting-related protein n=1 Tax=Trichosporon asahii var. asahii (strain ATCC 90039 / CBS 2479 / JCM 2466 / KCTC 7840 / NBRC 103889/ NCYC 2677 / UAMH 7654) TaxID=1186058 RepID=J4UFS1_TRIAS|nr:protein-vacuolar targeting-related protein [Trichosporon asahii var. asahii CBS 2479]EJT50240.1 protein-vacuolar targeting-related protein [Trichosporon asahii var. asahii CBS 2479]